MKLNAKILWVFFFLMPLLVANIFANETDDYVPDITAKVSRISLITGDVKIRRAGSDDWERAVPNLPVVEGDEIATDANALLEIQFDRDTYVRLSQSSYLKILNLKDEGAALSISQGSLSVRLFSFDKDEKYFEIDAPDTTVSIQKKGMYRIDAGNRDSREVRVTVTEDGRAQVYSTNSGFSLKDGRSAKIFLDGARVGEWEMADALRQFDEFDEWTLKRDAVIAKRLKDAYYDKYYDRDIYGAEDLNDYGEWIYTRDYGYVWKPYPNAISDYDNWSPYRYGHWRWIPPYGWTWVNDEAWGWATYHHGRWVYYNGYWVWTPYEYYRPRRSWWSPALVVFADYGNNVCWYPMPHRSRYRGRHHRNNNYGNNNPPVAVNPNPTPSPTPGNWNNPMRSPRLPNTIPIPATAVVSVPLSDFGRNTRGFRTAPPETARIILSKEPDEVNDTAFLPTYRDLNGKVSREIRSEKPPVVRIEPDTRIGAATRSNDAPLERALRQKQVFGNRQPVVNNANTETRNGADNANAPRRTGSVTRPTSKPKDDGNNETPTTSEPRETAPSRSRTRKSDDGETYSPPVRQEQPKAAEPQYTPPPRREEPRIEPPRREEPKYTPPPREERKSEPPPKRDDPPPQRSESKSESKQDKPSESRPGKKDN